MQYVRLAVPQELYQSLGFCPEMALLPSSDRKSIRIVPFSDISQFSSFSDSGQTGINLHENTSSLEPLESDTSAPIAEESDTFEEHASSLSSDLDPNNQTDLKYTNSAGKDDTLAIDVDENGENSNPPHIGMEFCQNVPPDHGFIKITEDSNTSGDKEQRESPWGKTLDSNEAVYKSVNIASSINPLDQGCDSTDKSLVESGSKDPVSSEEPNIDKNVNNSPKSPNSVEDSDCDSTSEDPLNLDKVMDFQFQSDSKSFSSSKKITLGIEPQSNKVPFIKVCDNCCRTYKAQKTFQRHKKNCERFKAELVSGKVRKERGSGSIIEKDILSEIGPKGPKTINHLIWKKGPLADITCEKCHWKFFSLNRYERHLTHCKALQTRGTDILDNSIEKDKPVKWYHAPTESTKKTQQYFVLRK